jgi:nitroreductase/NAD-dependent dihydropyrimidine dehydrogenase PreA subunit
LKGGFVDLITVNHETCNQDGICTSICPALIIEFKEGKYPSPIAEADELCIRCGHCVAVCPTASLSHKDIPLENCAPIEKELAITHEQTVQFLRSRRSIRKYKDKPVDKTELKRLIEIARYAPSGHNLQPVEWLVLVDKAELKRLSGIVVEWMRWMLTNMPDVASSMHMDLTVDRYENGYDVVLRDAPAVIVAHAHKENRVALAACTIALTYLELVTTTMGMGACWAGYFNAAATTFAPMQQALALPNDHQAFGSMMVGYPKYRYQRMPSRNEPKITWRL